MRPASAVSFCAAGSSHGAQCARSRSSWADALSRSARPARKICAGSVAADASVASAASPCTISRCAPKARVRLPLTAAR
eukprot:1260170-Prymnesium_polylepis.1